MAELVERGDLPEGQQSANVGSSWCSTVEGCHWASHMRGGASLYVKICTLCKRIDWDDLAEQVARVRADVAEEIARAIEGIRAGWMDQHKPEEIPGVSEALHDAAAMARVVGEYPVAPAESVVGAPTDTQRRCRVVDPRYGQCELYDGHLTPDDDRHRTGSLRWPTPVGALPEDEGTRREARDA